MGTLCAGTIDFCPALAALVGLVQNIFSSPCTFSLHLSPSPSEVGHCDLDTCRTTSGRRQYWNHRISEVRLETVYRGRVLAAYEADGEELLSGLQHLVWPMVRGAKGGTTPPRRTYIYSALNSLSGTEAGLVGRGVEDWSCLM